MYCENITAADVKSFALECGADLCTIGSIDRWKAVPKNENPVSIMPQAKSVICIAFRTQRGALRGAKEGTYFSAYSIANFFDLNRVTAPMVQRRIANLLEDCGYENVPIQYYAHNLGKNSGRPSLDEYGEEKAPPEVFFNFRVGGALCGMGEIGHSRLLLTREFGPAQRLYFLVTEAELEADPLVHGVCDGCMECVRKCHANALELENNDNIEIPDVTTLRRSKLNDTKCRLAHISGAFSPYADPSIRAFVDNICNGKGDLCEDGTPVPPFAEIQKKVTSEVSYAQNMSKVFNAPSALCGEGCVMACLSHLDKKGVLNRKFRHPF